MSSHAPSQPPAEQTESATSDTRPAELVAMLQEAMARHRAGNLSEAECLYRAILQYQPRQPDANHNLGLLLVNQGRENAALPFFQAALTINPRAEQFWLSYVDALLRLDRHKLARKTIDDARRRGVPAKIVSALKARLKAAVVRQDAPAIVPAPSATASVTPSSQEMQAFQSLFNQQRYTEMEAAARTLIERYPLASEGWEALAPALALQMRTEDAIAAYREALLRKPTRVETLVSLAVCLNRQEQREEAAQLARRAVEIDANHAGALSILFSLAIHQGDAEQADIYGQRLCAMAPDDSRFSLARAMTLPRIPASRRAIMNWRQRFRDGIEHHRMLPVTLSRPGRDHKASYFDLSYHGIDNRVIVESLRALFREKSPAVNFVSPHLAGWHPPAGQRRLRIGFCSDFLVGHTIGKLYRGFLLHLDRTRFEITLIHGPEAKRDAFSASLDQVVDHVIQLPSALEEQQHLLADAQLDVLFYPDIGMSQSTYFLAYARLAPVQAVSWGHPDTTGLDTLDYFVSADPIEPDAGESNYTERLILLSRLPCCYQPMVAPTKIPVRTVLGLPASGTLYGCPQSLFKFHPDFDAILAEIALGDPQGRIVVLEGKEPRWGELLRQRWASSFPILNERVLFLPHQPLDRFMALMAHVDVLLDPPYFGSGNTLYEALVYATPIVTWAGPFMRGRIVAGAYRQMGLAEAPIAQRLEDYAPLALAIGRDRALRQRLHSAIFEKAGMLYSDAQAVREFEIFLEAAVAAASEGTHLPAGWRPTGSGSPCPTTEGAA